MALFGYNYNKTGKGVDQNAPSKKGIFLFFELFIRKIFKYVQFNLLYFVIISPIVLTIYSMFYGWLGQVLPVESEMTSPPVLELFGLAASYIPAQLQLPLLAISILLYGPFTAGLTYVLRNFAREEHAWTSDFFSKAFENWRQGLFFGLLDCLAVIIFFTNYNYGFLTGADTIGVGLFAVFLKYFTIILFVFYFMMRFYFYQLIVTTVLPIRAILKNAWIFLILGIGRNILATVAILLTTLIVFFVHPLIEIVGLLFLYFTFCGFIAVFTTYPIIKKYIIEPAKTSSEQNQPPEAPGEEHT